MERLLSGLWRYMTFFLLMAFLITCCMLLFLGRLEQNLGLDLTQDHIHQAAILTFGNVLFLSLLCTLVDDLRRKLTVERPVRRIIEAAEKIMRGDFTVRIAPLGGMGSADGLDSIIRYFNKMAEELAGIETLRTDFIANVSHELKTPLAVMQNYGILLGQSGLTEDKRIEYAQAITKSSQRLADLITNILNLNKLENQQIYPQKQVFDLGEQLCGCLLNFENIWEEKKIGIETNMEEEVLVEADAELLTLVWNNLFSNAMKFTDSGGNVSLHLKSEGDCAVVQIADTGCGISRETGKHIFEKFYQGDSSHFVQGNGLGLALVKRVMDITGGDIFVESELGKGSTFTVKLRKKRGK